jgi:hypothetical protein
MKTGRTLLAASLITAVTILSGLAAGTVSQRWGEPDDLIIAGSRLTDVPQDIGEWHLTTEQDMPAELLQILQCTGYIRRVYRNVKTDEVVSLSLIVGPSGPTSVHRPEICYSSRDYDVIESPRRFKLSEGEQPSDTFWKLALKCNDLTGQLLHVAYAWNAGEGWVAPEHPRFNFAGRRVLYKLQLASPVAAQPFLDHADSCESFLRDCLPKLDAAIFPASSLADPASSIASSPRRIQ